MHLTLDQNQRFQSAVVEAFTKAELDQAITFCFNRRLEVFDVRDGGLQQVVFDLTEDCKRTGQLEKLIRCVREARTGNASLTKICDAILQGLPDDLSTAAMEAGFADSQSRFLNPIIADRWTTWLLIAAPFLAVAFATLANVAPLWPDRLPTVLAMMAIQAAILIVGLQATRLLPLNLQLLRCLVIILAVTTSVLIVLYWLHAGSSIRWNPAEERWVTIGSELTEQAQGVVGSPAGGDVENLFTQFHSAAFIWTKESIGRTESNLAYFYFSAWISFSLLVGCLLSIRQL